MDDSITLMSSALSRDATLNSMGLGETNNLDDEIPMFPPHECHDMKLQHHRFFDTLTPHGCNQKRRVITNMDNSITLKSSALFRDAILNSMGLDETNDLDDEISMFPPHEYQENRSDCDGDVDSIVAREMFALSTRDREIVYFDIHGVSNPIEETPQLVHDSLLKMEEELKQFAEGTTNKVLSSSAYNVALAMDAKYVKNDQFRLMFLRADRMDPKKAAERFVRHFQFKQELFGKSMLVKDITQNDLDCETMDALYDGLAQTLPERDRAGRLIVVSFLQRTEISVEAKLRRAFYGTMVQVEDDETQRKGCVGISYLVGAPLTFANWNHRREWSSRLAAIFTGLPIRFECNHLCHDSLTWKPIFALFRLGATAFTRMRTREHYGGHSECLFQLQTYGIPTSVFPLDKNGQRLTDAHKDMLSKRRALENLRRNAYEGTTVASKRVVSVHYPLEGSLATNPRNEEANEPIRGSSNAGARVGIPKRVDVLLGRGKASYSHVGNFRLRSIVMERAHLYENAGPCGKQIVADDVVRLIKSQSGRFLKDDGVGWVEVDDLVARNKVAHAFRTFRGLQKSGGTFPTKKSKRQQEDR